MYVRRGGVKLPLTPTYSGPFVVVSKSPKCFVLDLGDRQESVSVDRLKPHAGLTVFTPAMAPRPPPWEASYFIGGFLAVATWGGVVWRPEILVTCN